jgi:hypothetical protein
MQNENFKSRIAKMQKGADSISDIAVLDTQLMLSRMWLRPTRTEMDRIKKFIDINDSLDALESLCVGKINLGMIEWIEENNRIRIALDEYELPYTNLEAFRRLVKRRYQLYNIVLQSLGYYAKEIIRNDDYDKQLGENYRW